MPSFKLNPSHIIEAVYSYPFPEVRNLLDAHTVSSNFMLNTLPVEKAEEYLKSYNFKSALQLPIQPDGALDLDELHIPVIARIRTHLNAMLPGLATFTTVYPTPGSSQAIFTLIAEWKAKAEFKTIAVLEGEYEGYVAYAKSLSIPITVYPNLNELRVKEGELWFISNPNAVDGNFISDTVWQTFTTAGHQSFTMQRT